MKVQCGKCHIYVDELTGTIEKFGMRSGKKERSYKYNKYNVRICRSCNEKKISV